MGLGETLGGFLSENGSMGLGKTLDGLLRGNCKEGFWRDFRWFGERKVGGRVWERIQVVC